MYHPATFFFFINNVATKILKLAYGVDVLTSYVTTLHVLWFSILRFISLQWPHQFKTFSANYGKVCSDECLRDGKPIYY